MPISGPTMAGAFLRNSCRITIATENHARRRTSTPPRHTLRKAVSRSLSPVRRAPGIARRAAEALLDANQLIVFGKPVGARQRAGLDLPAIGRDREVGDRRILGLARAVRDHRAIAGAPRRIDGLQGFGQRSDLIQLY